MWPRGESIQGQQNEEKTRARGDSEGHPESKGQPGETTGQAPGPGGTRGRGEPASQAARAGRGPKEPGGSQATEPQTQPRGGERAEGEAKRDTFFLFGAASVARIAWMVESCQN